jgi:nucleotide-binding universal stress UspA family protein
MMQKFLAALDGSKASDSVLPYLETLLGSQDADVTLVRVVPELESPKSEKAYSDLNRTAKALRNKGAVVNVQILAGAPAATIVNLASTGGYSLILMGSRGKKGLQRMILGSCSEEVLRHSPVPVLIVHPRGKNDAKPQLKRIVIPLDGSHRSGSILPHVATLAKATGAKLLFMTAVNPRAKNDMPVEVVAKNLFREQKDLHRQGIQTELAIRYGDPATEILAFSKVQDADLLALSTHGRSGLDRALYGSVTESLLRNGDLPLLVLRTVGDFQSDPIHVRDIREQRAKKRTEPLEAAAKA